MNGRRCWRFESPRVTWTLGARIVFPKKRSGAWTLALESLMLVLGSWAKPVQNRYKK